MACVHQFGIIDSFSERLEDYIEYEPEKYNCISVEDDCFLSVCSKLKNLKTINPSTEEFTTDLCWYGITIIPYTSLEEFISVLENDDIFSELIFLLKKAYDNKKYVIHYGV